MKRFLISITIFILISPIQSFTITPHPELEENLRREGKWEGVVEILRDGMERGVDQPNPNPLRFKSDNQKLSLPVDQPVIVLLVDFTDNVAATPVPHYDSLLFSEGVYPTGSMRDYFLENSYGALTMTGTVTLWLRMPEVYTYYSNGSYGFGFYPNNAQKLTEDALAAADPFIDFSLFDGDGDGTVDALFVVHAGQGAEVTGDPNDIWSHAWVTSSPVPVDGVTAWGYAMMPEDGNIGVFCHEAGHSVLGLPDLYDYGGDSQGTGFWSLMSVGVWANGGLTPVHMDAWSKVTTGFVIPTIPTVNQSGVSFPRVEDNPVIYKLWSNGLPANEYFLLENRTNVLFDTYIPGPGLLIYHSDDTVTTGNNRQWYPGYTDSSHYLVAVEQADGLYQLEVNNNAGDAGDPWPGATLHRAFDDTSSPDTKDYTFNSTQVCVSNISDPGDTMTADLCITGVGVEEENSQFTVHNSLFRLFQNHPNPFHSTTTIRYIIPPRIGSSLDSRQQTVDRKVSLNIYDITGRLVEILLDRIQEPGDYSMDWNGQDLTSGVYFLQFQAGSFITTKKIVLLH